MEVIGPKERLIGLNINANIEKQHSNIDLTTYSFICIDTFSLISQESTKIIVDETFIECVKKEKIAIEIKSKEDLVLLQSIFQVKKSSVLLIAEYLENGPIHGVFSIVPGSLNWNPVTKYYERKGYTIIKFSDCILEEDFIDTLEFQEFVRYWKENDILVEFDSLVERKRFTVEFDNICQDSNFLKYKYVYWAEEWRHTWENPLAKPVLNYKDLMNWKELLCYKNKTNQKEILNYEDKDYKVLRSISCMRVAHTLTKKNSSSKEVAANIMANYINSVGLSNQIITFSEFKKYPKLLNDIPWFVENDFLEEIKEFEPFDITFKINNVDELKEMYCRMSASKNSVRNENSEFEFFGCGQEVWWKKISEEMHKAN